MTFVRYVFSPLFSTLFVLFIFFCIFCYSAINGFFALFLLLVYFRLIVLFSPHLPLTKQLCISFTLYETVSVSHAHLHALANNTLRKKKQILCYFHWVGAPRGGRHSFYLFFICFFFHFLHSNCFCCCFWSLAFFFWGWISINAAQTNKNSFKEDDWRAKRMRRKIQ